MQGPCGAPDSVYLPGGFRDAIRFCLSIVVDIPAGCMPYIPIFDSKGGFNGYCKRDVPVPGIDLCDPFILISYPAGNIFFHIVL